jgi:hypothetical protein
MDCRGSNPNQSQGRGEGGGGPNHWAAPNTIRVSRHTNQPTIQTADESYKAATTAMHYVQCIDQANQQFNNTICHAGPY